MTCSKKGCENPVNKPGYCKSCKAEYNKIYNKLNAQKRSEYNKWYYRYNKSNQD